MIIMGKRLKEINWKSYNKELIRRGSITCPSDTTAPYTSSPVN